MACEPVCMLLKRYPRLSETFVLNEILALERHGVPLHIVSLLRPEGHAIQPGVKRVCAGVTYFPENVLQRARAALGAHALMLWARPRAYAAAAFEALRWSLTRAHPLIPWKSFYRAGYVASVVHSKGLKRIHAHFAHGPAATARLASIMTGVPFSFTTHAKDLYLSRPAVLREHIEHAAFALTCTNVNLQYLRALARPADVRKVRCVYHGIDIAAFEPETRALAPSDAPLVLSVGRLVPKKGMDVLLSAIELLHKRGCALRCAIVGDGPLRQALEKQAKTLGIDRIVHFAGAMPHDRLASLYARAAVFALAPVVLEDGDRDGIPNVLVEAMSCEIPVVATNVSGVPELVVDGVTGLLVRPHDPQQLADAIFASIDQSAAARGRAAAGKRVIRDRFDVWSNARSIATLLASTQTLEA